MAVLTALGETRDGELVPLLAARLGQGSPAEQLAAAVALGVLGDPAGIEPLVGALAPAGGTPLRVAAAGALRHLGDPRG